MKINLDKYIRELLLQHDCVILPGLGGFVANYKPATFDASQKTALPPSRHILFNPNLVYNDGLLYAHISKETQYGYKEVQAMAEVYFRTIQYEVRKGLKFNIEDLGYFFLNKARKIEFVQETTDNLLLDSFGLSYLNYKDFSKMPGRASNTYRAVDESNPLLRQRRIRRWAFAGAAACLITAMILVPAKMGYINLSNFNLNPVDSFRKEQPVQEVTTSSTDAGAQLAADDISSTLPDNEPAGTETTGPGTTGTETPAELLQPSDEPVVNEAEPVPHQAKPAVPQVSYHIIIGSFRDFGNAQHLKQKMEVEGYDAEILPGENSFFRVSASHFPRKSDAMAALSGIRSMEAYKSAWILTQ
jgi:cell division septation protein DedD